MTNPEQWFVVRDDDHDAGYSFANAKVVAGPFDSYHEANAYIGWDDQLIAISSAQPEASGS